MKLTPDGEGKVKAELAFDKKDVDKDFNHIKYSLDGGKSWTDYKDTFTLTHNGTVEFKSYDDAGNESQVYTSVVKVERKLPAPDLTGTVEATKVYNKKGKVVGKLKKKTSVKLLSKKQKLHGKYYYRVGKNRYILASSLPKKTKKVKQVRARKNAKVYNKKGKVVGHLKKKQKVKLLSKKQKLHGKYYYRIGKNRYVNANVL